LSDSKYRYVCEDKSILYPALNRHIWGPALQLLPRAVSPNSLTILGSAFAWLAFFVLLALRPSDSIWFLIPAVANFVYLSLDNMDGMQARRTGRSSALGEFLDHWIDGFNIGIICFGYGMAMNVPAAYLIPMVWLGTMTSFASFWEQQVTGKVTLGLTGPNEGIIFTVLMYLLVAALGFSAIAIKPRLFGFSISNLALLVSFSSTILLTVGSAIWRVRSRMSDFIPSIALLISTALWFGLGTLPVIPALFAIVLGGAYISGRLVVARVLEETLMSQPHDDRVFYLLLVAAPAIALAGRLSSGSSTLLSLFLLSYLMLRLGIDFKRTVTSLYGQMAPDEFLARLMRGIAI
jgi:phosphatidylglycerophosphate synthase